MSALYRRLLGRAFDKLPDAVRDLHDVDGVSTWVGSADVERGGGVVARILALAFSLPPAGRGQRLSVTFEPVDDAEIWSRSFGTKQFVSTQYAAGTELRERVGPVTLRMTLQPDADGLRLALEGAMLFGVPLPRLLLPRIRTREFQHDGCYRFDVEAHTVFGLLVRYEGSLKRLAR